MIPLPRDFREFLKLLNRHRVRYVVVGGYSVVYHGYPRYTGDIDIFVAISPRNAAALAKVFRDFGFGDDGPNPAVFQERGQVVRIGREPMRLEILNEIDGVTFDACYARRARARIEGLTINFIGFEDLLANKRSSGRPKDLADVDVLQDKGRQRRTDRR
jgi:predicted nucleotidyltransferase